MIPISPALPALSSDLLSVYYARDTLLENLPVVIFYGPSTTVNSTYNTSRIQAHIFSLAGFQSFPRLTISPTSPLYAAVPHLPSESQGDEVCRGLAVGLLSYFAGLPKALKLSLRDLAGSRRPNRVAPMMFDEMHAGDLAARMVETADSAEIANFISSALSQQTISWVDLDVLLPSGTIRRATTIEGQDESQSFDENGLPLFDYGKYNAMIDLFGTSAFLPTSKLQRAPSRPTAQSKNRILSRDSKISLRREMCELIDTENNYLAKINELVNTLAMTFRQDKTIDIADVLFPQSLTQIHELNVLFYEDIQSILDNTENEAINDIEGSVENEPSNGALNSLGRRRDPTGATLIAKSLLKWFPKFSGPYQDYLRASEQFSDIITRNHVDKSSLFARRLHHVGEQRLRSALIEPVQRLPRYSLLIDNMTNLLPVSHPALTNFLKARDIITDICALSTSTNGDTTRTGKILNNLVSDWPATLSPLGRLITAVDIIELEPPFSLSEGGRSGIFVLFANNVVLLEKAGESSLSARGLLAEIDRPTLRLQTDLSSVITLEKSLCFSQSLQLSSTRFSESNGGHLVHMTVLPKKDQSPANFQHYQIIVKTFYLSGPYEGKAVRLSEEVAKARTEGRYPEEIRESGKWALRSISEAEGSLGAIVALSEACPDTAHAPGYHQTQTRISVDTALTAKMMLTNHTGLLVAASITLVDSSCYRLDTEGIDGSSFADTCTSDNLVIVLLKRFGSILQMENNSQSPCMPNICISKNRAVLNSLPIHDRQSETKHRSFRPISPVKMISNLLGGQASQPSSLSKSRVESSFTTKVPSMPPTPSNMRPTASYKPNAKSVDSKVTLVTSHAETYKTPLDLLEETFSAYTIALRSRSGNVVGKILRNRALADELLVNELYNTLLEDPARVQAAAEVSIDVLFAAFEKFLRRGWRECMGPLITPEILHNMQASFDSCRPAVFTQHFKKSLDEMSPQNKRAFTATIKLLSGLLDASGNDGDRGVLIASFAEALVLVGDPHDYITLLDRVVDDYDNLFGDLDRDRKTISATGSLTRTRSFNTGSLSSNASSLRKRFGFGGGLSRENSKNESDSKGASIWRTLSSKNANYPGETHSQPGSLSKGSLVRSRSTDTDPRMLPPLRPGSQDRPVTSSSVNSEESRSRPGSAHLHVSTLSSIGEGTTKPTPLSKKKRRSSLSDLKLIQDPVITPVWSPLQPRKPEMTVRSSPRTPSPTKQGLSQRIDRPSSPPRSGLPRRFGSPQRKEDSPLRRSKSPSKENSPSIPQSSQSDKLIIQKTDEVTITSYSPKKRSPSHSNIPISRGGLSERTWPPNGSNTPPKKPTQSPQKLRMQSPQKLRERLSQEHKNLASTAGSLQAEINRIGEEMSTFKVPRLPPPSPAKQTSATLQSISTRLEALSAKFNTFTTEHTNATTALRSDLETSLLVSDKKARKLDELYREANAENEALYERFNDELGKILGRVRKGEGVEELISKLREAQGDVGRLKGENAKLKREVVGLKSLVKGE